MHLFAASSLSGNFTSNIKITTSNVINDIAFDRDGTYNSVHHIFHEFSPGQFPNCLGEISIKVKENSAADFRSLNEDNLDNLYVILELGM